MHIGLIVGAVVLLALLLLYYSKRRRRMQVAKLDTYLLCRQPVEFTCPGCAKKLSFQLADPEEGVNHDCIHGTKCNIRLDRKYTGRRDATMK